MKGSHQRRRRSRQPWGFWWWAKPCGCAACVVSFDVIYNAKKEDEEEERRAGTRRTHMRKKQDGYRPLCFRLRRVHFCFWVGASFQPVFTFRRKVTKSRVHFERDLTRNCSNTPFYCLPFCLSLFRKPLVFFHGLRISLSLSLFGFPYNVSFASPSLMTLVWGLSDRARVEGTGTVIWRTHLSSVSDVSFYMIPWPNCGGCPPHTGSARETTWNRLLSSFFRKQKCTIFWEKGNSFSSVRPRYQLTATGDLFKCSPAGQSLNLSQKKRRNDRIGHTDTSGCYGRRRPVGPDKKKENSVDVILSLKSASRWEAVKCREIDCPFHTSQWANMNCVSLITCGLFQREREIDR